MTRTRLLLRPLLGLVAALVATALISTGSASAGSGARIAIATGFPVPSPPGSRRARSSAAPIAAVCSGVVPQQPPTMRTPSEAARRAKSAKYSGDEG